jgi:hypothetical protein
VSQRTLTDDETATMVAQLQKPAKIDPRFLASGLSITEWTSAMAEWKKIQDAITTVAPPKDLTTGVPPIGEEVAILTEPLLPPSSAPRTCLCKYTVAELVENLKGRTFSGQTVTMDGSMWTWKQGQYISSEDTQP